jgi:ribokinase
LQFEVVGLGGCNLDFIQKVPRFIMPDDEVEIKELTLSIGGSASNFTVGISRLNVKTGIIGRIGDDYFGRLAVGEFKKEGVDTKRLVMEDEKTGMSFIAVDPEGERSMYTFIGANEKFSLKKEDINYIKASQLLHITQMYKNVVNKASKHANFLSFNPGAILSSFGYSKLEKIIRRTDILFLNKKEMSILTGTTGNEGASILLDIGAKMVIMTCGEQGANLYTETGIIHSPARKTKVEDTTGAGDAFAAGFIAAYIKGNELKKCLDFANLVASCCVKKVGALNAPYLSDLNFKI